MISSSLKLLAAFILTLPSLQAADSPKTSKLDPIESPIPRQNVVLGNTKVVSTKDPAHAKVLEFTTDYPHPTETPRFDLSFKSKSVNPAKHIGLRIWVRSDNETGFHVTVNSSFKRRDFKYYRFRADGFKATTEWRPFDMYFDKLIRGASRDPKTGQTIGLDRPDEDDIEEFSSITFATGVGMRGTDGMGHLMLHKLELIEK